MYSQNNEQQIILAHFNGTTGTALDIGANDGKTFSNSLALIEKGWNACLVEPSPLAFEKLAALHGNNTNVELCNFAIGANDGQFTLHESGAHLKDKSDIALVSSLLPSEADKWKNAGIAFEEKLVDVVSWQNFLKLTAFNTFEFINIDVEGAEMEILPYINFNKTATRMVCIEWNSIPKNKTDFNSVLLPYGFTIVLENPENLIYAR